MKKFLLTVLSSIAMIAVTGCAESKPGSMTEGVELSDIEAYEQAVREMEAEDQGEMEINERQRETPAE